VFSVCVCVCESCVLKNGFGHVVQHILCGGDIIMELVWSHDLSCLLPEFGEFICYIYIIIITSIHYFNELLVHCLNA